MRKLAIVLVPLLLLAIVIGFVGCDDEEAPAPIGNCTVFDPWITRGNITVECYSEAHVLSELVDRSVAFSGFYEAESERIPNYTQWCLWPEMPSDYRALSTPRGCILLAQVPARFKEDMMIAHELAGYILSAEGFPWVGTKYAELRDVAVNLDDIATSPKRDSLLKPYGFDLQGRYNELAAIAWGALNYDLDAVNRGELINLVVLFKYLRAEVYWRYTLGIEETVTSDLYKWVHDKEDLSWFTHAADELVAIVLREGFETPEQMHSMFTAIINYCGLQGLVRSELNPR